MAGLAAMWCNALCEKANVHSETLFEEKQDYQRAADLTGQAKTCADPGGL